MLQTISKHGIRYVLAVPTGQWRSEDFSAAAARRVLGFHRTIPGYQPTRLVHLPGLARRWGVGEILVKDESTRFGLEAFKVLGGSYAVARLMCRWLGIEPAGGSRYRRFDSARHPLQRQRWCICILCIGSPNQWFHHRQQSFYVVDGAC